MVWLGSLPRLFWTIALVLVGAVVAMHALALPADHSMPAMPSHSMSSVSIGLGHLSPTSATLPMSACASAHCTAARGGETVAVHAMPNPVAVLATIAASSRLSVIDTATTVSRGPPRSGSCSPLCVWRQ